jgi:RNA polymerase sigma factor (sigma-70 family)
LVLDVRMPGMSGLELQKELLARKIELPTIIITGFGDVRMAVEAMKAGAVEFLEKPFRTQELCDLIQKAIKVDAVNWQARQYRQQVRQQLATLTNAERVVLDLVVAGKTNRTIAEQLGLSIRTIEDRRARMMRKLKVTSRADLLELTGAGAMSL